MTNRFPLIVDSVSQTIKELPSGDNLDLTGSGAIVDDITVNGDLTVDTNVLFADAAKNRVGIGTNSPGRTLDIQTASGDADARIFAQGTGSGDDAMLYLGIAGTSATTRVNFGDSDDADRGRIIYGHSSDFMSFTTAASEAMRITSSGNVGIGTSNPTHMLTVGEDNGTNPGQISLGRGGVEEAKIYFTRVGVNDAEITYDANEDLFVKNNFPAGDVVYSNNLGAHIFKTENSGVTEAMRINSSGNVGIGTSSPSEKLSVTGNITVSGSVILNGSTISAVQVTIADDAVAELTFLNRASGMLSVVEGSDNDAFPSHHSRYFGYVDFGGSPFVSDISIGSDVEVNTTDTLTGTTGTDGKLTIGLAGASRTLYLENRHGVTHTYNVTLL